MMKKILKQAASGLFILLAAVSVVSAGSFGISPVIVNLSAKQKISKITLSNPGTKPISVQLESMNWSQQEGKDVFTPTREILVNPPIFTVPANGSQTIRIGLRRPPDAKRELSYRIFLQELPPQESAGFQGTMMLMRLSLPVFISPEVKSKQLLRWHVAQTPSGTLKVSLINDGNVHIKINNLQLQLPSKVQSWVNQEPFQYVLPGQSRDWIMSTNSNYPPLPLGTALKLVAQTNTGKIKADVMTAP